MSDSFVSDERAEEPDWQVVDPVLSSLVIRIDFDPLHRRWVRKTFVGTNQRGRGSGLGSNESLRRLIIDTAEAVIGMQRFFIGLGEGNGERTETEQAGEDPAPEGDGPPGRDRADN